MKRLALTILMFSLPAWASGEKVAFPGIGVELTARMYAPSGKGPFPAIVMLHGCAGMWGRDGEPNRTYEAWAQHFVRRGYLALLVDSLEPRGEKEICTQRRRTITPGRERAADAHAALRWLAGRADVRPESIHLLGWSNGGTTVLQAIKRVRGADAGAAPGFSSAVAFYPGCKDLADRAFETSVPLLIQAGRADDWTPARYCESVAADAKARGAQIEIDVYEDAHHAFDAVAGRIRFRADVRNPSSPSGSGAHLGPNPEAREKSRVRTTEFIEGHR